MKAPFVDWRPPPSQAQHLPMLMDVRNCAFYALSVLAIKEERVNSVEDGDTNYCAPRILM
jgi:hypothetical protein